MPILGLFKRLRSLISRPKRDLDALQFSLGDREVKDPTSPGREGPADEDAPKPGQPVGASGEPRKRMPTRRLGGRWPGQPIPRPPRKGSGAGEPIPADLEKTLARLAELFHAPDNKDIAFRKFMVKSSPPARGFLVYVEGLANTAEIQRQVLSPLMALSRENSVPREKLDWALLNGLVAAPGAERKDTIEELVSGILMGEAALVVDTGRVCAFLIDIKNPPARSPSEPISERTILGPQVGFIEKHRTNTALVRSFIKDPDLMVEEIKVGRRTRDPVSVMYIRDIANPRLVTEVKRRLNSLDVDSAIDSGLLEQLIEDHSVTIIPTVLSTERPDRAALQMLQGAVVLIVSSSTRALVVPVTFSTFIHSAEDAYLRAPYASFLRVIRLTAVVVTLLLPGLYIAVVNFHPEMLPTVLLRAIAGAREAVPFPLLVEVVFMELSFELIREAGIRIPSPLGPTIGIVGALLIGDAAVSASLVSPIIVIIVALTALASFVIPEQSAAFTMRIGRFGFIILAGLFGLYGIAIGFYLAGIHLASLRSFGVPFLSPIGPWRAGSLDVIMRAPYWKQEKRPIFLRPLDLIRQARYVRRWDPGVWKFEKDAESSDGGQGDEDR